MSTDYLQLAVAVLYQMRDSLVAAGGYTELALETAHGSQKKALKKVSSAIERSHVLLGALETYRLLANSSITPVNIQLDALLRKHIENTSNLIPIKISYNRKYRLSTIYVIPGFVEQILYLCEQYAKQSKCRSVIICTSSSRNAILITARPNRTIADSHRKLINKKKLTPADFSSINHSVLLLVVARFLTEKIGGTLRISPHDIRIRLPKAEQLEIEVGQAT